MFAFSKNKELIFQLENYYDIIQITLSKFLLSIEYVLSKGIDNHFEVMVEEVSESEHDADNIRKQIEHKMFQQSLLPETREDLLNIIEEMDNIPDLCERTLYMIVDQQFLPIPSISKDLIELIKIGIECFKYTLDSAHDYLGKMQHTDSLLQKVNDYEHIGDKLERKMIKLIFSNQNLTTGEKLIQKEIVKEIGNICNKSKHTAQRIIIASIKRKI